MSYKLGQKVTLASDEGLDVPESFLGRDVKIVGIVRWEDQRWPSYYVERLDLEGQEPAYIEKYHIVGPKWLVDLAYRIDNIGFGCTCSGPCDHQQHYEKWWSGIFRFVSALFFEHDDYNDGMNIDSFTWPTWSDFKEAFRLLFKYA